MSASKLYQTLRLENLGFSSWWNPTQPELKNLWKNFQNESDTLLIEFWKEIKKKKKLIERKRVRDALPHSLGPENHGFPLPPGLAGSITKEKGCGFFWSTRKGGHSSFSYLDYYLEGEECLIALLSNGIEVRL